MIIGICGLSRSGKDTSADTLVNKHHFVRVAFADPMKRFCMELFQFTEDQLWGDKKNEPDKRYPREHAMVGDTCACCLQKHEYIHEFKQCYLTPRYALQQLGTEWARSCYRDVWMEYTVRVAQQLLRKDYLVNEYVYEYTKTAGLEQGVRRWAPSQTGLSELRGLVAGPSDLPAGVVIPDARYRSELAGIKRAGGKVVRVKRPSVDKPEFQHTSETEQMEIPDDYFDYILDNSGDLHYLELQVDRMLDVFKGSIREYDQAQANVPPYQRK